MQAQGIRTAAQPMLVQKLKAQLSSPLAQPMVRCSPRTALARLPLQLLLAQEDMAGLLSASYSQRLPMQKQGLIRPLSDQNGV
jgi:hypothetical protein